MTLSINQHRRIANLVNRLDLLANRHLKALGEPFHLTLPELWQWRERLRIVSEEWDKLHSECSSVLADAALLHQVLQPAETALAFALVEYLPNEVRAAAEEREWEEAQHDSEDSNESDDHDQDNPQASGLDGANNDPSDVPEVPSPIIPKIPEDPGVVGASHKSGLNREAETELTEAERVAIFREELNSLKTRLHKVIQLVRAWSQREPARFLP